MRYLSFAYFSAVMFTAAAALTAYALSLWLVIHFAPYPTFDIAPLQRIYVLVWGD